MTNSAREAGTGMNFLPPGRPEGADLFDVAFDLAEFYLGFDVAQKVFFRVGKPGARATIPIGISNLILFADLAAPAVDRPAVSGGLSASEPRGSRRPASRPSANPGDPRGC
jgi:hypothetical protein